ncbi:MAG TPA: prepilin-type N-terminal cleavage/methylation domain-containing protein [Verrucomicrobiae bacterium]|nr:prepilin-type N-terminal cleavage/methylation domain-containing protein [Verrucomicrobiae bacterium]
MARGFTLLEILVAMAMGGLVMAGTLSLLLAGQGASAAGEARAEAIQGARVGLERMATELRQAGYDPQGAGFAAIEVAEPERIVFLHDLNENGVIDPTRERVTYLLRGTVLRRDAGGGAQPLVEGVQRLRLVYYDHEDRPTMEPAQVASVGITLEVARRAPTPVAPIVMGTRVRLRNERRPPPTPT